MLVTSKKGQNILEYVILLCVILSALLIMQVYVKRRYQGRIKQDVDELGQQYSPGHTTSQVKTKTTAHSETCTGGKCWGKDIDPGMTVTISNTNTTLERKEAVGSFATEKVE